LSSNIFFTIGGNSRPVRLLLRSEGGGPGEIGKVLLIAFKLLKEGIFQAQFKGIVDDRLILPFGERPVERRIFPGSVAGGVLGHDAEVEIPGEAGQETQAGKAVLKIAGQDEVAHQKPPPGYPGIVELQMADLGKHLP